MKKLLAGLVVGFLLVLIGTIAQATTITAIYGSGNSDDGWTSSTTDGITLALRAKVRYVTGKSSSYSSVTYDGDSTYNAETGESTSGVAAWNFDFSIDVSGVSDSDLADYTCYLDIYYSATEYVTVNIFNQWTDNSFGVSTTENGSGEEIGKDSSDPDGDQAGLMESNTIAQNSQNIAWILETLLSGYDYDTSADATYKFVLYLQNSQSETVASTSMTVVVGNGAAPVPEPSTMLLLGAGIVGLAGATRRKLKK